jgi:hypothetical protein
LPLFRIYVLVPPRWHSCRATRPLWPFIIQTSRVISRWGRGGGGGERRLAYPAEAPFSAGSPEIKSPARNGNGDLLKYSCAFRRRRSLKHVRVLKCRAFTAFRPLTRYERLTFLLSLSLCCFILPALAARFVTIFLQPRSIRTSVWRFIDSHPDISRRERRPGEPSGT